MLIEQNELNLTEVIIFLVIHFAFLILIIIKVVYLLYIMKFIGLLL